MAAAAPERRHEPPQDLGLRALPGQAPKSGEILAVNVTDEQEPFFFFGFTEKTPVKPSRGCLNFFLASRDVSGGKNFNCAAGTSFKLKLCFLAGNLVHRRVRERCL